MAAPATPLKPLSLDSAGFLPNNNTNIESADASSTSAGSALNSPDSITNGGGLKAMSLNDADASQPPVPPSPSSIGGGSQPQALYGPLIIKPWPGCPPCVEGSHGHSSHAPSVSNARAFAVGIASPNSSSTLAHGAAVGASLASSKRVAVFNTGG